MKRRQSAIRAKQTKPKQAKRQQTKLDWDEEIESSEDGDFSDRSNEKEDEIEEESDEETAEQKRKRCPHLTRICRTLSFSLTTSLP